MAASAGSGSGYTIDDYYRFVAERGQPLRVYVGNGGDLHQERDVRRQFFSQFIQYQYFKLSMVCSIYRNRF